MLKRAITVMLVLLLASGCGGGGTDESENQSRTPSQVERVEEEQESAEETPSEPKAPEPPPLEQPNLTAEEALILLVPDDAGVVPIQTPEDLMALSALVASGDETHRDMTFQMQKNINLSGIDFIPIGGGNEMGESAFGGLFDGAGFQITGLTIRDNGNVTGTGLFGHMGAGSVVNNLHVVSGKVSGSSNVGGLAGTVEGSLFNCSFNGVVEADGVHVGGLVGSLASGDGDTSINQCFVNADVTGAGNTGGFVGTCPADAVITDCYALGEVNVVDGGAGKAYAVGGFAGECGGAIVRCFSNNEVYTYVTAYNVGGFIGSSDGQGLRGCYYNQTATENWKPVGSPVDEELEPGVTGCTVSQLVEEETYLGWDFAAVWEIDGQRNRGLPFLRAAQLQ